MRSGVNLSVAYNLISGGLSYDRNRADHNLA